jgi:Putative restriction endonuclease
MVRERLDAEHNLLEFFHETDTPEGIRAEFIEGEIVVSPPRSGPHEYVFSRVNKQIIRQSKTEMLVSGNRGLQLKRGGHCPKNHVVPDAVVVPEDLEELFRQPDALYLLVDQEKQSVTLFNDPAPAEEDYRGEIKVHYGKPLPLHEPFGFALDTNF